MGERKHDDAHRPFGGRGKRAKRTAAVRPNWGGTELLTAPLCDRCGVMKVRQTGTWICQGCGEGPAVVATQTGAMRSR